jgi:hypothetical protein
MVLETPSDWGRHLEPKFLLLGVEQIQLSVKVPVSVKVW